VPGHVAHSPNKYTTPAEPTGDVPELSLQGGRGTLLGEPPAPRQKAQSNKCVAVNPTDASTSPLPLQRVHHHCTVSATS
jgi:hypothetical protein